MQNRLPRLFGVAMAGLLLVCLPSLPVLAQTAGTAPVITSVALTPATSSSPAQVTIDGTGFGSAYATGDTVTVAGFAATVVTWSDTALTVAVPNQAGPGPVTVTTATGTSNAVPWTGLERGYYTLSPTGQVAVHGALAYYGDLSTLKVTAIAKTLALTPDGKGYWILTTTGQVYGFGDAKVMGSAPGSTSAVTLVPTPDGQGYWILGSDGTVYAFGDAHHFGNPPSITAVGMAATPDGQGYWILGSDGTVYPFGDAVSYGDLAAPPVTYADGTLVRQQGTPAVYLAESGDLRPVPSPTILRQLGQSLGQVENVPSLAGETEGVPVLAPFLSGTILATGNPAQYYIDVHGVLRPVTAGILASMGYNPAAAIAVASLSPTWPVGPALTAPLPLVPNGGLIRVTGEKTVYLSVSGGLHPITSPAVLYGMGDTFQDVRQVPALPKMRVGPAISKPVAAYPTGSILQAKGQGALYLVLGGVAHHILTKAVFLGLGYIHQDIRHVANLTGLLAGAPLPAATIPPLPPVAAAFAPTPDGHGYWILGTDGTLHAYGDASVFGQAALGSHVMGIVPTPDGAGYLAYTAAGIVEAYGDASLYPGTSGAIADVTIDPYPTALSVTQSVGWGYFDTNKTTAPSAWWDLQNEYENLSAIAPDWFGLWTGSNGQPVVANYNPGTWTDQMMSTVTGFAQAHGVAVWPSVGWAAPGNIDLLRSPANQASIIQQIVGLATTGGYNGMTIDFEGMGPTLATGGGNSTPAYQVFNQFVSALASALHQLGKTLMVAVYPASYPLTIYDYPVLAQSADYLNVMMYPEYNSGYPSDQVAFPGPTSGLPWAQNLIQQDLATGVSSSQLLLGLAPYGYYWTYTPTGFDANASGYMSDADQAQLIAKDNRTVTWDPWEAAQVFTDGSPAVAPPAPLKNNLSASHPSVAVEELQSELDYVLLRYAVESGQTTEPIYLATDGWYGPETTVAVTQFQQDFKVNGATPGVYDAATATALKLALSEYDVRQTTYWDETPQSIADLLGLVHQYHLGGVAPWRLGFEQSGYWTALAQSLTVGHIPAP
jgi:spore germination protein YaaH